MKTLNSIPPLHMFQAADAGAEGPDYTGTGTGTGTGDKGIDSGVLGFAESSMAGGSGVCERRGRSRMASIPELLNVVEELGDVEKQLAALFPTSDVVVASQQH